MKPEIQAVQLAFPDEESVLVQLAQLANAAVAQSENEMPDSKTMLTQCKHAIQ